MLFIFVVEQCSLVLQLMHCENVLLSQILNALKLLIFDSALFYIICYFLFIWSRCSNQETQQFY